jgi:hypothetical protein
MTVEELLTGRKGPISTKELNEWKAMQILEPFGPREELKRAMIIACAVYNATPFRKPGSKIFVPEDFLTNYEEIEKKLFEAPEDKMKKATAAIKALARDINQAQKKGKVIKKVPRHK